MKKVFVILTIGLLFLGLSLNAESLEDVLKKNYAAKGGLDKINAIKTIIVAGTGSQHGVEFPMKLISKRPNKIIIEAEVMGKKIIQAYNGKEAWWIMPLMGINEPTKMPEEEAKDTIEQAEMQNPLVDYKKLGHKLEFIGKEDMEGTSVYKLKLTAKDTGKETLFFLDEESGIEIKTSSYRKKDETEMLVESFFGDYKEVAGVMMPHQIEARMNGQVLMNITIVSYKVNEEVADSAFEIPAKK
jgi:outer membrane lipoprotein-sorting protein